MPPVIKLYIPIVHRTTYLIIDLAHRLAWMQRMSNDSISINLFFDNLNAFFYDTSYFQIHPI